MSRPPKDTVTTFPFLSDAWVAAAEQIHAEYSGRFETSDEQVRVNVVVTEVPFGDGVMYGHIDTSSGNSRPDWNLLEDPEATVTIPYGIARNLFVTQDFEAVMMAFMTGQMEIEGDVTRLLYLQDLEPSEEEMVLGQEIVDRLMAITDD